MAISLGKGIIHEYYTVALVPAIGALIGIGGALMWKHRESWFARTVLALALLASTIWAYTLLGRTSTWAPALRPMILILGIAISIALLVPMTRRVGLAMLGAGLVVALAAPTAYTLSTVRTAHTGSLPTAGPASAGRGFGPGGGGGGGGFPGGAGGGRPNFAGGTPPGAGATTGGVAPGGTATGGTAAGGTTNGRPSFGAGGAGGAGGFPGGGGGGIGGLLNGTTVSTKLSKLLQSGSDGYRWTAAAVGANNAASYQLASGKAVMAIGGFNGSDPAPTLTQFKAYVHQHKIHYLIGGGVGGGPGGSGTSSAITTWVAAHYKTKTVGGVTLYDFTQPTATTS
jgi:hypothetical protein